MSNVCNTCTGIYSHRLYLCISLQLFYLCIYASDKKPAHACAKEKDAGGGREQEKDRERERGREGGREERRRGKGKI